MFIVNTILSGFVVYEYYLDSQTTSTYITNILFMVTKLADVYANVNTERNVFYSAYMKGKIQYNDVDPNKLLLVPGISPPVSDNEKQDEVKEEKPEEIREELTVVKEVEEEDSKIIVTIHDINSPTSSSNDLQGLNDSQ
jgi:hypothetical protein